MRVTPQPHDRDDDTLPKPGTVGEVIGWQARDGVVYFRIAWYGRPGTYVVHHELVEVYH